MLVHANRQIFFMNKLSIRGIKREEFSAEEIQSARQSNFEIKASITFNNTRGDSQEHKLDLGKNDLLEFVFEDDTTWVGSKDILHDLFPVAAKAAKRGSGDEFSVPMYLETGDSDRGLFGTVALKLLNVFTKKSVPAKVMDIAAGLEKKLLENQSGVFGIDTGFHLQKNKITETKKPNLLFIHGTNSSTRGSFAEIQDSEFWKYMQNTYGPNIFGLQHETMTKSPIQNVIDLFNELPDTCTLHIITHSRGGLVGDVLARFSNGNGGFSDTEITYLQKTNRADDLDGIKKLQKITAAKKITIEKFIRVACPAYGTTILSKRLDHFLNISFNLIGLVGGVTAVIAAEFKNLLAAAVDVKNDPKELPGLEAMNPDSAFLKVLNNPVNSINGSLTVISGNCGLKLNLKALLIIASKLFYMRDNDLVVDTKSMYCGSKRNTPIQYFFDEGPDVDHVHYFKNKKTQEALLVALKATTVSIPGFTAFEQSVQQTLERNALLGLDGGGVYTDKVSGNKPIVILLPGIMGSNLEQGDKKIWINYLRFLAGDLTRLDISKKDITASSLIKTSYKKLVDYLSAEYDVVTLPFDWRLPMADAAALLKDRLEQYLALKTKPAIKIIGHSMGGVVTRDFIINHPATWKKLNASKDFKLLLLGAPLGGSYRIPYVLAGKDPIITQLSKIDLLHTKKELLDMFRKYPGLLGLLPVAKDTVDFADENVWKQMKDASSFSWNIPDKKDLQFWGAYRDNVLKKMDSIELENIIYIAGKDDATVCGFDINNDLPDEKLVFKSTAEGDQSVTWDTGIPKQLNNTNRLYFADVSHGALANNPGIFDGIAEILKKGQTELLSGQRPALRSIQKVFDTVAEEVYETDERGLENYILGIKEKPAVKKTGSVPLKVSISNGDLYYSKYPVLVGHFLTDGITGAEAVINKYTGNLLRGRHRLNLYPGDIGTNEVFVNFNDEFKGVVVIGLGTPGRLSAMQLTKSVENGAINYIYELRKSRKNNPDNEGQTDIGISALLIGSSYGNLSIGSSMRAIILGIQNANNKIEALKQEGIRAITDIEFVELYEDRCLQCLYLLDMFQNDPDSSINFWLTEKRTKKLLGSRTRIPIEKEREFWNRIAITEFLLKKDGEESSEKALRFSLNNSSAREEQRDLYTSPEIINELVEEMSANNNWNEGLAKSVFELLIPNDFKDEIKKQYKTMWVLDNASAGYPWELLHDFENMDMPFCCSTGMIRQLQTDKYRLKINASSGSKAFVVGDPNLNGYPFARQLEGARKEAEMVADLLGKQGYEMPNNCIGKSSKEIIQSLFKYQYRIIHLAGHGIFNEKSPDSSGMLIGNGIFLTAREIYQMSKVPDLVFVNCCFLGKVSGPAEELFSNRYKLAANIGTQLIMNGVKVVIAAGWAVDDEAAKHFTETFYDNFLKSTNFGDSIQAARKSTFDTFPNNNTWGAYQCYGDPYYSLPKMEEPPKQRSSFSDSSATAYPIVYLSAQEAEIDLNNLFNQTDSKGFNAQYMERTLSSISAGVDAAGLRNAVITEKEAMVYAECNNYEKAIAKFESLMSMEQAGFTLQAIEKYCNIRAKLCVKNWQAGIEKNKQTAKMDKVIEDLKQLLGLSPTSERLSLTGSAYKRKAMIVTAKTDKLKALVSAADYYQKAKNKPQNINNAYSLINWLEMENILVIAGKHAWAKANTKPGKTISLKSAKEKIRSLINTKIDRFADIDFWNEISIANASLCLWLLEGGNTAAIDDTKVLSSYQRTWGMAGSQNKKIAEIEHFDFLIDAYSAFGRSDKLVITMKKIRNGLMNSL
jgi:CHAT domain-containing protein/pimeloyl-ACP methyl ester carboxylesterase